MASEKNKNQTAQERARMKEALGAQPTRYTCASVSCSRRDEPILQGELFPIVVAYPSRRTVFYHRNCAPKLV